MAKQLLQNRGFDHELDSFITQGSVSTNNKLAYSGEKSAQLLATPTSIAEISQLVFFISPGSPVNFSFVARRFLSEDVKSLANIRAEVNFINVIGMVIPPGIVITISGREISGNEWKRYHSCAVAPFGTVAAQAVIRLEPPENGTSGLLVDNLALFSEVTIPTPPPVPAPPVAQGIPAFPGFPFTPPPPAPAPPVAQGIPVFPGFPFTPPPPAPSPPVVQGIPAFPGFPFTPPPAPAPPVPQGVPLVPDSPVTNPMFEGTPCANVKAEAPAVPKQEDHGGCPSKGGDTSDPG